MGDTSSEKLDEVRDKLLSGDRSKEAALNLLTLENADKRSDALLDRFKRDPSLLSPADKQELQTYLQVYAYEMSREYGSDMAQELVKGLLSGNEYLKRSPDNGLQRKAQSILAGWSTQESQAAVGTPALLALSGPIGATLRAATAAGGAYQFGTGVGQLIEGDDTWAAAGNMASGALAMSAVVLKPGSTGNAVNSTAKPGNSTAKPIENVPNSSETYFRVEGGGNGTQTSQNRINVNSNGTVTINSGCSGQLCVSTNGSNHAAYYLTNRRQDGSVIVFEVDAALHKQIMDAAVPQRPIPGVPRDPDAPKIVDPTKGQPSVSLELPKVWDRLIEQNSSKARVLTKEEFLNEFNK